MEMVANRQMGAKQHGLCPIVVLVPIFVLMFAVVSWGACHEIEYVPDTKRVIDGQMSCSSDCGASSFSCPIWQRGTHRFDYGGTARVNCSYIGIDVTICESGAVYGLYIDCEYWHYCDTQAEADSANCVLHPNDPSCEHPYDTTLTACNENIVNGQPVAEIYVLSCQALNGVVQSCNGKTNVDIATDGRLLKVVAGTCGQNGYQNGVQDGADSTGQNAECFAIINGYTCVMRDKVSGNTFKCDCDGDCDYAMRKMAMGECGNPYERSSSSGNGDSLSLPFQSSASSSESGGSSGGTSSEGGGESSPSSSGGSDTPMSDFEYDYTNYLINIQANTQYTGTQLERLNGKADKANNYLEQIANKNWSVNVSPPEVNVELNADTAKSGKAILDWLTDNNWSVDTSERNVWRNFADSLKTAVGAVLDSSEMDSVPDLADSMGGAVQGIHTALSGLKDTLQGGAIADSLGKWQGLITNNGVISGAGSSSCPAVLTRTYTWTFPLGTSSVNVNVGSIGQFICSPIAGVSVTIWALIRILLRASVAIGCMWWLYRAVTGTETASGEED